MHDLNVLLISQCLGYFFLLIFSLCSFISITVNVLQFKGICLLFTNGTFDENDGSFEPVPSNFSYCGYTIAISFLSTLISLIQFIRMLRLFKNGIDCSIVSAFWDTVIPFIFVIMVIFDSIIVTVGFALWCKVVTKRFQCCEDADSMKFKSKSINADCFYLQLGVLQFGIWASLVNWVFLVAIAYRKFHIFYQREKMVISMARERKRYLDSCK